MTVTVSAIASPRMLASLWKSRALIYEMTRRDIVGRYKGSLFGIFWAMIQPLLMLSIYTFVFTQVFHARWHVNGSASEGGFALNLFAGLIVFNVFSECANRSPGAILAHATFVTRVVFPLEIIPVVQLLTSLFHVLLSLIILVIVQLAVSGSVPPTIVLFPLALLPLSLLSLGVGWLLAATGVYWRDIGQMIGVLVTGLLFVSPVFFPADALPARFRFVAEWNPVAYPIELMRSLVLAGKLPNGYVWLGVTAACAFWAWVCYSCFQRLRRGFADVL